MLTGKVVLPQSNAVAVIGKQRNTDAVNVSVLIPSRGNLQKLLDTIQCLLDLAAQPDAVEVIVRRDADEQVVVPDLKHVTFIVGKRWGYKNIQRYYQECFRLATGYLIWIFDDDTHVQTRDWDAIYGDLLREERFGVAAAKVVEDDYGADIGYPWAVPVITRALACQYDWLDTNTERVMDAYATLCRRGKLAPVTLRHRNRDKTCAERASHCLSVAENFPQKCDQWTARAKKLFERTLDQ